MSGVAYEELLDMVETFASIVSVAEHGDKCACVECSLRMVAGRALADRKQFLFERDCMISRAETDASAYRRDDAIRSELLAACRAQHTAIDRLFAMLVESGVIAGDDRDRCDFYPSKSGQPWDAMVMGNKAIEHATARSAGFKQEA